MASYYVRSAAAGAGTGADWTNAYTTLSTAITGKAAGDTFYVADDHAETQASAMTLTSPGTSASPIRIICVNTHVTTPPTATATSATVTTTGAFNLTFTGGGAYVYGITFSGASGAVNNGITFTNGSAALAWTFDNCTLKQPSTNNQTIALGSASGSNSGGIVTLINTSIQFGSTGQGLAFYSCALRWFGGSVSGSTFPTSLLQPQGGNGGKAIELYGVDLSNLGSGKSLVSVAGASSCKTFIRDSKLGASVSAITGTVSAVGNIEVYLENCDVASGTNYRFEQYKYQGSIKQETSKVRASGGATDGTTTISHNMTTLASGPSLFSPLEGPWVSQWNETTGSSITITVECCTENVTLTNADCYLEAEYLGTTGNPLSLVSNTRAADIFATPANLTTSAVSWNGFSVPAPQKMSLTFTPQVKGLIRARVCVAKASATVYVDPQIAVGSGPTISRSYLLAGFGTAINETSSGAGSASIMVHPGMTGGMRG